jgi:thioredoxin 2
MTATSAKIVVCADCGTKNRVPAAANGTPRCAKCHTALPWLVDADDDSFDEVAVSANVPVLVDLWAPWCGPCKMVSPALDQIARDRAGQIKLVKVNVDEAPGVAQRFKVQGIPTLVVMDHGEVLDTQIGAASESALRAWLDRALAGRPRSK